MSDQVEQQSKWRDCSGGEIAGMLHDRKLRGRRRFLLQVAGAAGLGAVGGFAWIATRPDRDVPANTLIAGISCKDVRGHAPAYVNDDGKLTAELRNRIVAHVEKCGSCAKHIAGLKRNAVSAG